MVELLDCGRTLASGLVAFTVRWSGSLPEGSAVQWSMFVSDVDGGGQVQLGLLRSGDGSLVQFVDDETSGRRSEVDVDADLPDLAEPEGGEVTVRFPEEVVGVAAEWSVWRAVLVVGGEPHGECTVSI